MIANKRDIRILCEGGKLLSEIIRMLSAEVVPGISTLAIEENARKYAKSFGGKPAFLGYTPDGASRPYPAAICMSVNEEVVHGIPNEEEKILRGGDIVTLDMGLEYKGFITDMAVTVPVGKIDLESAKLVGAAKKALEVAIATAHIGSTTGDIGAMVEAVAINNGFSVPKELGGHGVGNKVHEPPFIPNLGTPGTGEKLKEGMVLAIEPIIIAGSGEVELSKDGYTFVTKDKTRAAQFEHTVIVGNKNAHIITAS